jgi:subtilisin family serine protease
MGTIVAAGDGTAEQPAVGVAPRARWIAARACSASACTEADLIAAAQWLLAPTDLVGSNPRPDLRPLIVNNSWAGPGGNSFYTGYTAAWRAAGMFPVFSAGNGGAACGTIASAADYANVVAVGATTIDDTIASFSARGPAEDGRRKPDFAAPGQLILSTVPGGAAYAPLQGTSMAAPHVSGLIALLWSANPALIGDYDATYAILRDTARGISDTQCGDAVGAPNNVYGYGRIDAYAAVARARVDVPWLRAGGTNQLIAASGSATVTVTLDAAKVPGPGVYRARLQIFGADLTQPPATIGLTMTVTPAPQQAADRAVRRVTGPVRAGDRS